jgi:hypothetical protein
MKTAAADIGKRAIAIAILLAAAYLLLKLVVGLVAGIAWIIVGAIAVLALIWAVRTL